MLLIVLLTTAVLVGGALLRPYGLSSGLEGALFALLTGLLCTATLLMPITLTTLWTAGAVLVIAGLVGMTGVVFQRQSRTSGPLRWNAPPLDGLETGCACALAAMGLASLLRAVAPPVHPEALILHLALAKEAVLEGHTGVIERHSLSDGLDMGRTLRALLYLWKSSLTVMAWQLLAAAIAVAALFLLVRRIVNRRAAFLAAAAFAAMPAVLTGTLTAANDLLAAAFIFTAMLALARWRDEGQSVSGALAGLMMGGACATGAIGWLALPGWFLLLVITGPRGPLRSGVYGMTPTLAVALAWLVVAHRPPTDLSVLNALHAWLGHSGAPSLTFLADAANAPAIPAERWFFFPWDSTMRPALFEGPWFSPGPLALVLGPPALLWGGSAMRRMAFFALALALMVMCFHPSARLLMPACALLLAAAAAVAVERGARLRTLSLIVFTIAIACGLVLHGVTAAERIRVVTGLESVEDWRARRVPAAPALAWCNTHAEDGVVLSFDPHGFLLDSPVFVNYPALAPLLSESAWRQTQWLHQRGIRYIVLPETAIFDDAVFRVSGLSAIIRRWQRSPNRFIQRAEFHDAHGGVIYIYEVRDLDATF